MIKRGLSDLYFVEYHLVTNVRATVKNACPTDCKIIIIVPETEIAITKENEDWKLPMLMNITCDLQCLEQHFTRILLFYFISKQVLLTALVISRDLC